ncbi:MAG: anaerobic sulfatase maturase [bacterium]|nr:anaerobic sulfatase maturase [bacterium]
MKKRTGKKSAARRHKNSGIKPGTGPRKILDFVLVKPAGPDCNMACGYCFYLEKAEMFPRTSVHRMSETVLREMTRQVMSRGDHPVSFGWQGGEPTLMGLPFFRKAVAFQEEFGENRQVGNSLQTNGLLLDRDWAVFLRDYRFLVGLSLDGPRHIHDYYRKQQGGAGSWQRVTEKLKLLLDNDVQVNALTVVNDYSVDFAEEIYAWNKSAGLSFMQFIPCVEPDADVPGKAAPFSVPAEKYGQFLITLFDLWLGDFVYGEPTTSVRFFDSLFYTYVDRTPPQCTLLPECGTYLVVEYNGNVYACDFYVEPRWKLGNVAENRLTELLNSSLQNRFGRRKSNLPPACLECKWLVYCRGGCVKDRRLSPEPAKPAEPGGANYLCAAYRAFFEHAHQPLVRLAENWKRTR